MTLAVSCRVLGLNCDFVATGDSLAELLDIAADHDVAIHGASEERVRSEEWREELSALVKNTSLPPDIRAARPNLTQVEPVEGESTK